MNTKRNDLFSDQSNADYIAEDEHENNFRSRRGTGPWGLDDDTPLGFYIYDNNPWSDDEVLRDLYYAKLEAALAARGCKLQARGSYPKSGEEADYTISFIYHSATPERIPGDHRLAVDFMETMLSDVYAGRGGGTANA